jgi:hypothetical protein
MEASDALLSVNPACVGALTTIYVKYQVEASPSSPVFAVIWLKSSSQVVVGMALPEGSQSPYLVATPKGMAYRGLSKYLVLRAGDVLPDEFSSWAAAAYINAVAQRP